MLAFTWQNAKCKCKFANKHTQANAHSSEKLPYPRQYHAGGL